MPRPDGGPAFPEVVVDNVNSKLTIQRGMTLRDWLAGMALQVMKFSAKTEAGFVDGPELRDRTCQVAQAAYAVADAMLKAREAA